MEAQPHLVSDPPVGHGPAQLEPPEGRFASPDHPGPTDFGRDQWKAIALRVKDKIVDDQLSLMSGGVAFFIFLSLFPALTATILLWGLFAEPASVQELLVGLSPAVPKAFAELLTDASMRIVMSAPSDLGLGVAISLLLAVWSANMGMSGLVEAVAVAWGRDAHQRGFVATQVLALLLTLGALVVVLATVALVVVLPLVSHRLGLDVFTELLISLGRWPFLAFMLLGGLAVIYRVSPPRDNPRWRWVTPGAVIATFLWILATIGFSFYVSSVGSFDELYGPLAAIAVTLMWLYLSAFIVLLGAEVNSEAAKESLRVRAHSVDLE